MPKVLIIESESSVAQSLTNSLQAGGAEAVVTGDGAEALTLARQEHPDLIVLCVELSRGSGYSVCNKLKKDSELSSIPLILTSSQATEETFEQHKKLRTRAEAYLKKPYQIDNLLEIAGQYVSLEREAPLASNDDVGEFEVSLDDASFAGDDLLDVSVDESHEVTIEPSAGQSASSPHIENDLHQFSGPPTQVLVSDAEAERMRGEIRQLRQKVQKLEHTLQEKELEFNDRLLEESARARDAVDIKKKVTQLEREISKHQQAAQRAQGEVERLKQELKESRKDASVTEGERQVLSDKIGQLVDKVKALAAERDQLQKDLQTAERSRADLDSEMQQALKLREKAKKAVDIALQLLDETGLIV
jgi:DNA-binding response OmpR family regulator